MRASNVSVGLLVLALTAKGAEAESKPFRILVQRGKTQDGLIIGKLSVNGKEIGTCYENAGKHVPAGSYKAHLRNESTKNHVQGPGGKLGKTGDFLVELDDFTDKSGKKRTAVQFHAGNKPEHSDGCILGGPATKDASTGDPIAPETPKKLRLEFYDGKDKPDSTPDKAITVEFKDP